MKTAIGILVSLTLGTFFCFVLWIVLRHDYDWAAIAPYWKNILSGWWVTLLISAVALVLSVVFGAVLTAGQLVENWPARFLSRTYIELIRGTPLLTQILIGYYLVANSMGWDNRFWVGVVILACFAGAYLAEIFLTSHHRW